MYAVIRTGGKQYRVSPGDVIRIERRPATDGQVEFSDVLAVSAAEGQLARPTGDARVVGSVVEEGRADKILVFHYKRKKQYKKLAGHRQPFTAVRITEIAFDGQKFAAPDLPEKKVKAPKAKPEVHAEDAEHKASAKHEKKAEPKAHKKEAPAKHEKKAAAHKPEAKGKHKAAPAKHTDKKKKK
jgi:large subunit ribosomal protein L21